ncbi:hypothetical protein TMatcc_005921 [Talaromyces marneffei ATCC 18224]|uniref:Thioesterase family protein n=1 Tax=Talaromyces marneffei (strain ATCC 18224 / CBS 334.59 / QM 7333) TaxID=441960 RepID=B6Q8N5_TALMQ|nr:uncharacterized protein EYB26_005582 [Talaromyces marneffei]EEA25839.1 conserved hypothetical protein [Talaromyces marneffei ATCC 18224]KAE8554536.1 hypothetical protein EYB25_003075 [Talaromyces marneffei]QGA17906.1 hypothetical protein EYB26_005582 [Talaromyces marneffei]
MSPPHTQVFEDGITVTPISSHTYATNVHQDWTIGAVPHGGYTMSILYRLAITHFKHTHPTRHNAQPLPISMQMTFLRRTAAGPATLTVEDSKLGLRTSTIHVTLSQEDDSRSSSAKKQNKKLTAKVVGYITVSDPISDVGPSIPLAWELYPPAPSRGPPSVVITADNVSLSPDNTTQSKWRQTGPTDWAKFRLVEHQCITFGPTSEYKTPGVLDQWARLRTVTTGSSAAGNGKWTNETLPFLSDWFPAGLEEVGSQSLSSSSSPASTRPKIPPFWYPTVTLNIDFKKSLPPQGVDWLYSRVVMKSVRNGRMDIEVIIMDEQGEIVALCSHIGLVVPIERNTSGRKYEKPKI